MSFAACFAILKIYHKINGKNPKWKYNIIYSVRNIFVLSLKVETVIKENSVSVDGRAGCLCICLMLIQCQECTQADLEFS